MFLVCVEESISSEKDDGPSHGVPLFLNQLTLKDVVKNLLMASVLRRGTHGELRNSSICSKKHFPWVFCYYLVLYTCVRIIRMQLLNRPWNMHTIPIFEHGIWTKNWCVKNSYRLLTTLFITRLRKYDSFLYTHLQIRKMETSVRLQQLVNN